MQFAADSTIKSEDNIGRDSKISTKPVRHLWNGSRGKFFQLNYVTCSRAL